MHCFLLLLPRGTWKSCEEIIRTAVKRLCQNHTAEISLLYIYPVVLPWLFVLQYLVGWLLHHCLHFDVHSDSEQHFAHLENRDTVFRDAIAASVGLTLLLITSTSLSVWLTLVQTDVSLQLLVGLMFYTLYRHCWYSESESWRLLFFFFLPQTLLLTTPSGWHLRLKWTGSATLGLLHTFIPCSQ